MGCHIRLIARAQTRHHNALAAVLEVFLNATQPGRQFDLASADELAAWNDPVAAWNMLQFGLRVGKHPRWIATTTPRPLKLIKELLRREARDVVVTRGSTFENAANLAQPLAVLAAYDGTGLGRQELNAELLLEFPGALWTREMLERANEKCSRPTKRVVVAIDPSGTRGPRKMAATRSALSWPAWAGTCTGARAQVALRVHHTVRYTELSSDRFKNFWR